jgi:hypothetical protein
MRNVDNLVLASAALLMISAAFCLGALGYVTLTRGEAPIVVETVIQEPEPEIVYRGLPGIAIPPNWEEEMERLGVGKR